MTDPHTQACENMTRRVKEDFPVMDVLTPEEIEGFVKLNQQRFSRTWKTAGPGPYGPWPDKPRPDSDDEGESFTEGEGP